jgi:hypothetical protein
MQARGLDFMSSPDIELKGGVHVLIGELPEMYLHYQQYKGRTNRLDNKGQYSVVVHARDANSLEGKFFVECHLNTLKNLDLTRIS